MLELLAGIVPPPHQPSPDAFQPEMSAQQFLEYRLFVSSIFAMIAGGIVVAIREAIIQMTRNPRCICGDLRKEHDYRTIRDDIMGPPPCTRCGCRSFIEAA